MLALGAWKRPGMLELQLSGDPDKVKQLVTQPNVVRRLRRQLLADYVFITFYWLTFIGLSIATARREGAWYEAVGLLAAFAASLTAVLDVIENLRSRGMLALTRPSDQVRRQPVVHLRRTSLLKWAASAVTLAVLAVFFLAGHNRIVWLGFAFVAVAAVGAAGIRWNRLLSVFMIGFVALGGVVAVTFTFCAGGVLSRL